ncbi:MAG: radical SAM/SPASM domain-containing protein [Bacillota bacterium]|nr:radical SAM/SPASM domain-containing protein [Bacillota bacterium]
MKRFKKVYVEITSACNLSCSFCPQTKRAPKFMKVEEFSDILDMVQPFTDYVYFHVKGEPLLHPQIDILLDLCAEKGLQANITTNGTLIGRAKDKLITKPALRQVNISLHSFDANEGNMDMDVYLDNILRFSKEASEKTEIITAFRLWNLDQSNITNSERQKNRHILGRIESFFGLPYRIEDQITKSRGVKLCERVFLNQDYEFKWPGLEQEYEGDRGSCHGLKDQIAILVDGTVVPCCLDGEGVINLGNIHNDTFSKIIEGTRAKNILEGFSRRELKEELCRRCGYRSRFNK